MSRTATSPTTSSCPRPSPRCGRPGPTTRCSSEARPKLAAAFDAVEQLSEVLGLLEKQLVVVTLMRRVIDRGLRVAIGEETGVPSLADCSLVLAPYSTEGSDGGTIAVIGPTRMDYPQALSAVAAVSRRLGPRPQRSLRWPVAARRRPAVGES